MPQPLDSIRWARRLKLRHLEVFVAVHESGSLTAAAAQLHMTQPALSHWLADTENVIGSPLFVRGRRLVLTGEGQVLLQHAARMLGDVRRTDAELRSVHSGLQGRLHVGTGMPRVLLPKAIARLHQERPGIFISVLEASMPDLLERLAKRELDVVISALSAQVARSRFATESLMSDRVEVVARRGNPLLLRKTLRWKDTESYPWTLPPIASVMRGIFDEALASHELRLPSPCVEASSSVRVQLLMEERNYLSILSAAEVHLYRPLKILDTLRLARAIPAPDIGAIWEADRVGAPLVHFLEALRVESRALVAALHDG